MRTHGCRQGAMQAGSNRRWNGRTFLSLSATLHDGDLGSSSGAEEKGGSNGEEAGAGRTEWGTVWRWALWTSGPALQYPMGRQLQMLAVSWTINDMC